MKTKLVIPENVDFGVYKSSLMHGAICKLIDPGYADGLHQQGYHPYSQSLIKENGNIHWVVNTLDSEAEEYIIKPLMNAREIYIDHNDLYVGFGEKSIEEITADELFFKYGMKQAPRKTEMIFLTPTAFKSNGKYVNIPTIPLVFGSLIQKYDAYSGNSISDEGFVQEINERVCILTYNLRSAAFPLEGITIPAFIGRISFYVKGGGALPGMIRMLCEFARFSGIGIKTAIGMGAVDINQK